MNIQVTKKDNCLVIQSENYLLQQLKSKPFRFFISKQKISIADASLSTVFVDESQLEEVKSLFEKAIEIITIGKEDDTTMQSV